MRTLLPGLLIAILAVAGCSAATHADVETVNEAQPAISQERLNLIESTLQEEVDAGVRSGFVVMIGHNGKTVYETAVGMADIEAEKPMTIGTQFRIASMTKPITTLAVMMLVERGDILLSDPVDRYIPSFASLEVATSHNYDETGTIPTEPLKQPMTIHDLLTHTAGLGYIFDGNTDLGREMLESSLYALEGDLSARIASLANFPLYAQPGNEWRYSYATDVAGRIVEVASGMALDEFIRTEILTPLGMNYTGFFIENPDFSNIAKVYIFNEDGDMLLPGRRGNNPDPNTDAPQWVSGGGGLVSTAGDYMRFMQLLLNEGELDGVRIVSPATVRLMLAPNVPDDALRASFFEEGRSFGLGGWVSNEPGFSDGTHAKGQFGWGGYYDTSFSISPEDNLAIVVLAQREPGRFAPESRAKELVSSIAFGALE